jgi:hypothetical protein
MIKGFQDFLNESENQRALERALDMVIYHSLGAFSPDGGNMFSFDSYSFSTDDFKAYDPIFGDNGPDTWVNCGDFNGEINNPLQIVVDHYRHSAGAKIVKDAFKKYGMIIQELDPEEVILELDLPYHQKTTNSGYKKDNVEAVVKFYKETQPNGLKELKAKLGRGYIEGTKIGLI